MKSFWFVAASLVGSVLPVMAVDVVPPLPDTAVSTATIAGASVISPGRYVVNVTPNFNAKMAKRLEKAVGMVPGLEEVTASSTESTITFTVKEGSRVQQADIEEVVAKTHNRAAISTPVLKGSLTPKPGL